MQAFKFQIKQSIEVFLLNVPEPSSRSLLTPEVPPIGFVLEGACGAISPISARFDDLLLDSLLSIFTDYFDFQLPLLLPDLR